MNPELTIRVIVAAAREDKQTAWAMHLLAFLPDGRSHELREVFRSGELTKDQANYLAINNALQCILPEHQQTAKVNVECPGHLVPYFKKDGRGMWKVAPRANSDYVLKVRQQLSKFKTIEVVAGDGSALERLVEEAKKALMAPPRNSELFEEDDKRMVEVLTRAVENSTKASEPMTAAELIRQLDSATEQTPEEIAQAEDLASEPESRPDGLE
jgi:hypothetical protein